MARSTRPDRSSEADTTPLQQNTATPAPPDALAMRRTWHILLGVAFSSLLVFMFGSKLWAGAGRLYAASTPLPSAPLSSPLLSYPLPPPLSSQTAKRFDDIDTTSADDTPARYGVKTVNEMTPSRKIPRGYRVVRRYPHDSGAFTQGLSWHDNSLMYESYGHYGRSGLRAVQYSASGEGGGTAMGSYEVVMDRRIEDRYFAEGLSILDGVVYQLTWQEQRCLTHDPSTLRQTGVFEYRTTVKGPRKDEGWGLTHNGSHLIVSDGTDNIIFWNTTTRTIAAAAAAASTTTPETSAPSTSYEEVRRIAVTDWSGTNSDPASAHPPIYDINELEFIHGWIFANVWYNNYIHIIDPVSGDCVGKLDMTTLKREVSGDVLNGIAYTMRKGPSSSDDIATDAWGGRMWVTGKLWNVMFEIELTDFVDAPPTRMDVAGPAVARARRAAKKAAKKA